LIIYPNPSNGIIKVIFPGTDEKIWNIDVYNDLGVLIYKNLANPITGSENISFENYPNGMYHLILSDGKIAYHSNLILDKH
jgi:hypothetical protein